MKLISAISRNIADWRTFGPRFPLRHLAHLAHRDLHHVAIDGIGSVGLRPGTTDAEVFRQIFQAREYDLSELRRYPDITARYEALLSAGHTPVIVDAGANIGAASLWFARAFPRAAVVAVEPDPDNAARCRANVAAHQGVTVCEAAIGATAGRIRLTNPAGKAWSPRSERSEDGIPVITLPELVAGVPGGALFIAKIDIEGFESDLFAGDPDWIDDAAVIMVELHDWMMPGRGTSVALQRTMGMRGFEVMIRGENLIYFNPEPRRPRARSLPADAAP